MTYFTSDVSRVSRRGPSGSFFSLVSGAGCRPPGCPPTLPAGCSVIVGRSPVEEKHGWGTTDEQTETPQRDERPMGSCNQLAAMVTTIIVIIVKQLHPLVGSMSFLFFLLSQTCLLTQLPRLQKASLHFHLQKSV